MLSFRRLAVTATAVAALAAPTAAQARPDIAPASQPTIDKVSPDARYGVPDETTPAVVTVPRTDVVEADDGFAWGDALIGGGAALGLTLLVGGTAVAVRPRHSAAIR
jgi:hypothetical protein